MKTECKECIQRCPTDPREPHKFPNFARLEIICETCPAYEEEVVTEVRHIHEHRYYAKPNPNKGKYD